MTPNTVSGMPVKLELTAISVVERAIVSRSARASPAVASVARIAMRRRYIFSLPTLARSG
jgi:hypothetical protein